MKSAPVLLRLMLAVWLVVPTSCATSPEGSSSRKEAQAQPRWIWGERLEGGRVRLSFEAAPPVATHEVLRVEEALAVLAAFHEALPPSSAEHEVVPALASSRRAPAAWERRLREEFVSRYGPGWLPLPESVERSPLYLALKLSPRYMGAGVREAAQELFRSPAFLASVALAVLVYFSAWVMPEPLFTKSFAAAVTVRLALAVGVLELRNVALACLQLYRDAQAARSLQQLEAVAERFGRALGGTALRVLIMAASFGVARGLPKVPPGGLGAVLSPPRYAVAGGMTYQAAATAHVVADGTLIVAGAAVGMAGSALGSACTDGSEKKSGYQWHHLATDKNDTSTAQGGPWTPLFARLFAKAGMGLEDPANLVYLAGHKGPHPEAYHSEVYDRLRDALEGCRPVEQCRASLLEELKNLARDLCSPGSRLHRLATRTSG